MYNCVVVEDMKADRERELDIGNIVVRGYYRLQPCTGGHQILQLYIYTESGCIYIGSYLKNCTQFIFYSKAISEMNLYYTEFLRALFYVYCNLYCM